MDRLHQDQYAHDARDLGTRDDACPRVPPRGGLAMVCGRRVRLARDAIHRPARDASHTLTTAPAGEGHEGTKGWPQQRNEGHEGEEAWLQHRR